MPSEVLYLSVSIGQHMLRLLTRSQELIPTTLVIQIAYSRDQSGSIFRWLLPNTVRIGPHLMHGHLTILAVDKLTLTPELSALPNLCYYTAITQQQRFDDT